MPTAEKLPDFLVIGAPKAGTTALFRALARHPGIFVSPTKEPRFFAYGGERPQWTPKGGAANAARIVTSEKEYKKLFAGCGPDMIAGEASVGYLSAPPAPQAAFRLVPKARLVALLRHPVARAYSQWQHLRQEGNEPLANFEDAWNAEEERTARRCWPLWQYKQRGFYGRDLARWLEFFPREQLLVLFYEDWVARPVETLNAVFAHVGVHPVDNPVITRENWSSRQPRWSWLHHRMIEDNALRLWAQRRLPLWLRDAITGAITGVNLRPGARLDPEVRSRLSVAFHDDLNSLEKLTGRNLSAWRQ